MASAANKMKLEMASGLVQPINTLGWPDPDSRIAEVAYYKASENLSRAAHLMTGLMRKESY